MSGRCGMTPREYDQLLRRASTYPDGSPRPSHEAEARLYRAQKQSNKQWADLMAGEDQAAGRRERIRRWRRATSTTTTRQGVEGETATLPGMVAVPRRNDDTGETYWQSVRWAGMTLADLTSVLHTAWRREQADHRMFETARSLVGLVLEHRAEYVQEALEVEGVTLDQFLTDGRRDEAA